jgi:Vitamin K-dependent gamma-carboxylase.
MPIFWAIILQNKAIKNVGVFAQSYVALNGRISTKFIDDSVDLYKIKRSFKHKKWVLPFTSDIKIKGI